MHDMASTGGSSSTHGVRWLTCSRSARDRAVGGVEDLAGDGIDLAELRGADEDVVLTDPLWFARLSRQQRAWPVALARRWLVLPACRPPCRFGTARIG